MRLPILLALALAVPAAAAARDVKPLVIVVPVEGAPVARDVGKQLFELGHPVERGGSATPPGPAIAPPLEAAKACVAEGHALAFRLEFAAAIRRLADCEEKLGGALARPEGIPALSAILVELAAASVGAEEKERARGAFAKLAQLAGAVPPDPALHPPEVIAIWDSVRREVIATKPALVEASPRWTKAWIDGRAVTPGARVPLAPGPHFAVAEAAGHAPFAGIVVVEAESPRVSFRLPPLEEEARYRSLQNASPWIFGPDDPDAAAALTDAFNAPVLLVSGGQGRAPTAVLFVPGGAGRPPRTAGRWTAVGEDAPRTLAKNASRALGVRDERPKRTLLLVGGAAAAVLAAGAAATLAQPRTRTGDKTGTVVFE